MATLKELKTKKEKVMKGCGRKIGNIDVICGTYYKRSGNLYLCQVCKAGLNQLQKQTSSEGMK